MAGVTEFEKRILATIAEHPEGIGVQQLANELNISWGQKWRELLMTLRALLKATEVVKIEGRYLKNR